MAEKSLFSIERISDGVMARISFAWGERGNSAGADFAGIVGTYGKTAVTTEERCHPSGGGRRERFYVNRVIPVATVF